MNKVDGAVATIGTITGLVGTIKNETDEVSAQVRAQEEINYKVNGEVEMLKEKSEVVKTAMTEQKYALNEIARSIANINEFTQNTVQAAELLVHKAREVDDMAAELVT
jgi:methyl-accepting chemotaxis protein